MKTSNHAKTRIKERCGLGKDSGDRLAAIALEKGLKRNEANGQLKRYMDKLYFTNPDAGNIRIYAEKVWIFSEDKLVTVFGISKGLKDQANTQIKRKSRKENLRNDCICSIGNLSRNVCRNIRKGYVRAKNQVRFSPKFNCANFFHLLFRLLNCESKKGIRKKSIQKSSLSS